MVDYRSSEHSVPPPPPGKSYDHKSPRLRPARGSYLTLAIIGIVIIIIGGIIGSLSGFIDDPLRPDSDDFNDMDDYQKADKEYREDSEKYKDNVRLVTTIGDIVEYIGVLAFGIGMLLGALTDNELSQYTKLGMLIAIGVIIGFKIGGAINYYWF